MKNFFKTLSVTSIIFSGSVFGLNPSFLYYDAEIEDTSISQNSVVKEGLEAMKDMQYQAAQVILDRAVSKHLSMWSKHVASEMVNHVLDTVITKRSLFNQDDPSETLDYSDDPNLSLLFPPQSSSPKLEDIKTVPAAELIEKQIEIWSGYRQKLAEDEQSSAFLKYYEEASNALLASVKERTKTPEQKTEGEVRKKFAPRYEEIKKRRRQDEAAALNELKSSRLKSADEEYKKYDIAFETAKKELEEAEEELSIAEATNATEEKKKNVAEKYNNAQGKYRICYDESLLATHAPVEARQVYEAKVTEITNAYNKAKKEIDEQFQQELDKLKKSQK